jgi:hypothetical protein
MVALKLQNFGGMLPAVDSHLLPESSASLAENAWVTTGALQGFKAPRKVYDPVNPRTRKVFRVPAGRPDAAAMANSYWLEFPSANTDVVPSPVAGDAFERFYWASDTNPPYYNTKARIARGDPPLLLGVPQPDAAPGVVASDGTSDISEVRAYVYTWVTEFGEESPPSLPTVVTAPLGSAWALTFTPPGNNVTNQRALSRLRIYRTVSGVGGETDYFFVAEVDITDTTYNDTVGSVTGNQIIRSLFWTPPPADLKGFVAMPNGVIAAWRDNEIWFCEPYRPHAWPSPYQLSVDAKVVGCGAVGQTLIVCTEGAPYAITGVNPGSMAQSRLGSYEPCTARNSIVPTPSGVAYSSPNGIVLASAAGAVTITSQMMQREDWASLITLSAMYAAAFNGGYYALAGTVFGGFNAGGFEPTAFSMRGPVEPTRGVYVDPSDGRIAISKLTAPETVYSVQSDLWTGELFIHRADGVFWFDQTRACTEPRLPYKWRSKILETPYQKNFEAMRVYLSPHDCSPPQPPKLKWIFHNGVWDDTGYWLDQFTLDGKDMVLTPDMWGIVRVFADGRLCLVRELRESGEFMRLPSGFKATFWQVEIEARVRVESIELATTAKELARV